MSEEQEEIQLSPEDLESVFLVLEKSKLEEVAEFNFAAPWDRQPVTEEGEDIFNPTYCEVMDANNPRTKDNVRTKDGTEYILCGLKPRHLWTDQEFSNCLQLVTDGHLFFCGIQSSLPVWDVVEIE